MRLRRRFKLKTRPRKLSNHALSGLLRELLKQSTWKRHPAPFAKTERGRCRREERRFVDQTKRSLA